MAQSNFIDYVKIYCCSGKGGRGSVHFQSSRKVPRGGPDGGDGGHGGHIILRGDSQKWTLLHLRYTKHILAENGENGSSNRKTGCDGKNVYIDVPLGTVAKDAETGEFLAEVTEPGQEIIILKGGRGGQGNDHFKTSTNQAPRYAQPGEDCVERWVIIELKLLADVGLVGFPNAGKSTLLSVISAAKPEIADYPFTTLVPNLGVVPYYDEKSFVVADIPGIIEGAADGKGLGLRFLRHIERNSILLFLIPANSENIREEYNTLVGELEKYNPELLEKKRIISISKADLCETDDINKFIKKNKIADLKPIVFSSAMNFGLTELKDRIWEMLQ